MPEIRRRRFFDLTDPIINGLAPWHSKIGQEGFPSKFIWEGDSNISKVKTLKLDYDDVTRLPKKISAQDQDDKSIQIEIVRVSDTRVKANFSYDGNIQAELEEQITAGAFGNKLKGIATYRADSDLNFEFEAEFKTVNPGPNTSAWIKITFNNATYEGWITRNQADIPQVMLDYNEALGSFAKQGQIAALNEIMVEPMALGIWQFCSGIGPAISTPDQDLCFWIMMVVDGFTGLPGTIVWFIINLILIYYGVPM